MAERGTEKRCCRTPFFYSEFYSYYSYLAFLEKRAEVKKCSKIGLFCTFLHVFLPFCRTSNPLLSAMKSSPKGLLFRFMKLQKRREARDSNKEGASAGCGRKQSGGLFSPTGQRAKRGDRRGQRRTANLLSMQSAQTIMSDFGE